MESKEDKYVLIGAGLPRTGTASMRLALLQLLGGECYHMYVLFQDKEEEHPEFWNKALKRQVSAEVRIVYFLVVY